MTRIACYCRVSTEDQSMDRQLEATGDYARDRFDASIPDLEVYRDKSTGTNTKRSGYKQMMADVEAGEIVAVVVNSVSRVCRSISDLDRTAKRLEENDVALHIVQEGLVLDPDEEDPYQMALFQLLGVFAELEAAITQQRVKEGIAARQSSDDYHHGPAPLGFEKDDGQLVEDEDYHDVVAVLDMVHKDELSKRAAAKRLNTSRPSIYRALESQELYAL